MKDYTLEAETLFQAFASRHSFIIERIDEPNIELLMRVPRQSGLSFELTLGLQNLDEINIGIEKFWSYFFPFPEVHRLVANILDDLVSGSCRLATYRQFGGVVKRTLEQHSKGTWSTIYTAPSRPKIPFIGMTVLYLQNDNTLAENE